LGAWNIRRLSGSQDDYHQALDRIYRLRVRATTPEDGEPESGMGTWDRKIVPPPADFPAAPSLQLKPDEAEYLRERIVLSHPHSLLALLATDPLTATVDFPWEHPAQQRFSAAHRELLDHARIFSGVMHGAALIYNVMLAELRGQQDWADQHRAAFDAWSGQNWSELEKWNLTRFWQLAYSPGHTITPATRSFVEHWVALVSSDVRALVDRAAARELIRFREQRLKGAHSRFANRRALDQWRGTAGLGRVSFRWRTVQQFLSDLESGFTDRKAAIV
jgi:hypothetical protein